MSEADAARVRAETRCRLIFECCDPAGDHGEVDLPVYDFATEDACVARFQAYYQGIHDEARAAGLTYNPECLGFEVAGERAFGCGQGPYQGWCVYGDIYHGDVAEGGACSNNIAGYFDQCGKGLTCLALESDSGVCQRASVQNGPQPEGVDVEIGEPCNILARCKLGAFCSPDTHTCVPGLSVGADCHDGVCAVGSYCKSFTCTPLLSEGAPCEDPELRGRYLLPVLGTKRLVTSLHAEPGGRRALHARSSDLRQRLVCRRLCSASAERVPLVGAWLGWLHPETSARRASVVRSRRS